MNRLSSSPPSKPSERVFLRRTRLGLELRIDGTVASLVHPGRAATGPVWDALAAPLLALRRPRPQILILGLAGGSVARVARALVPGAAIVGVDKDVDVVDLAVREFGLRDLGLEVVVDDALQYLRRERRRFDAVIEDLMVGTPRSVRKPDGLVEGYDLVTRRVARGGVLVVNTIHETPQMARVLRRGRGTLVRIGVLGYYNAILARGPASLRAGRLRARLAAEPLFDTSLPALQLRTLRQ
jgi:spermidine synthase